MTRPLNLLKKFSRVILLIMVGMATVVLWIYGRMVLPGELAQGGGSVMFADRSAGILTVLAMIVAPAIPIQSLFPKNSAAAAAAVGWMPLAVGLSFAYPAMNGSANGYDIVFAIIEGCVDWGAMILGARAVARLRQQ